MKLFKQFRISTIMLLFIFGFVTLSKAVDNSIEEMNSLLEKENMELKILKDKIKAHNRKVYSVGAKQKSILKKMTRLENQTKLKERELEIYKWNIKINQKKVKRLIRSINQTQVALKAKSEELREWLRVIYKEGGLFPVKVLFSANDLTDLLKRVKYMDMVTEYDAKLFFEYEDKLKILNREKKNLLLVRSNLLILKKEAEIKANEYLDEKNNKRRFLRKLKREKSMIMRVQKELLQSSNELDRIIENQLKRLADGEKLNINDHKGQLDFPVKGPVINQFGRKRDKRYDAYTVFNGINIQVPQNSPIRAIYSGKVLFNGYLEGYGNLIILGHGKNFHSVYGHLKSFLCKVNQPVRKGQIIARSGDSGSMIGDSLYFELRQNGKAVDPAPWFHLTKK